MKSKLINYLDKIYEHLLNLNCPINEYINDGVTKKMVLDCFENIGLVPSPEIIDLYTWHNGTNIIEGTKLDYIQFIPGFHLLSLEDAIYQYNLVKEDQRWNKSWFPFMANGGGDFYNIDLTMSNKLTTPIVGFILGELAQEIEYENMTSMMKTFYICYEKKIIYCSNQGYLDMNDQEYAKIALKINSNIKFWWT